MNDRYTKTVLTVIAGCLVYSTAKDVISTAFAQSTVSVNIAYVGNVAIPQFGAVPVQVRQ